MIIAGPPGTSPRRPRAVTHQAYRRFALLRDGLPRFASLFQASLPVRKAALAPFSWSSPSLGPA